MDNDQIAEVIAAAIAQSTAPYAAQFATLRAELNAATGTTAQYRALRRHFPAMTEMPK